LAVENRGARAGRAAKMLAQRYVELRRDLLPRAIALELAEDVVVDIKSRASTVRQQLSAFARLNSLLSRKNFHIMAAKIPRSVA
jgi:hypothetical protein